MLDRKAPLYIFYPNLCRRLPFKFIKEVEIADGVQLLRYGMPKDVFDDPEHNPANECYCDTDSGTCPPKGIINVTACAMGAPALASFPHFRHGDPSLRNKIDGLNPEPGLDDSYLDIHPTLGIALSGKSSLQINVQVTKSSAFSSLNFLEEGLILPVAWIEMGLEELPESLRSLVYHGTYSIAAAQLGLTVFCILALTVSSICLFVMIVRRRRKPCAVVKILPADVEMKSALS